MCPDRSALHIVETRDRLGRDKSLEEVAVHVDPTEGQASAVDEHDLVLAL